MENQLQPYSNTLMAELSDWKRLETEIANASPDNPLEDRVFLKLKLQEYERLGSVYKNSTMTRDDKAMFVVLQYHRAQIERFLYPGIIRRLLRKAALFIRKSINERREPRMAGPVETPPYARAQSEIKSVDTRLLEKKEKAEQSAQHEQRQGQPPQYHHQKQHQSRGQHSSLPKWKRKGKGPSR